MIYLMKYMEVALLRPQEGTHTSSLCTLCVFSYRHQFAGAPVQENLRHMGSVGEKVI